MISNPSIDGRGEFLLLPDNDIVVDSEGNPVGGTVYMDGGSFENENDGQTYLTQSPLVYTP